MDMQALQTLQQARRSDHLHARHEKAEKLYKLGMEYLQRAKRNEMDRELLGNAAKCFAAAIENNRSDPRAYLQQAYLLMLVKDGRKAVRYVLEAQRLDPNNPRVHELLAYLKKEPPKPQKPQVRKAQVASKDEAMTHRRNKLAAELEDVMNKAYRELQNLQPTWVKPVWQGYCRLQEKYEDIYQNLCDRLDQIGKFVDIAPLDDELHKLEISLNRLDDVCELSEQMVELYQRIDHLKRILSGHLDDARNNAEARRVLHRVLDKYQPALDTLADELDMMEGSGFNIAALLGPYEEVIQTFQQLDQLAAA